MSNIDFVEGTTQEWETVFEGVERKILRAQNSETRVLLRIAAGKGYPAHTHAVPDEVFVVEGTYVDPGLKGGKEFGAGSYLYYPAGTEHNATTPTGCTILVWNTNINGNA